MSYSALGWSGDISMAKVAMPVEMPIEEWSNVAASSAYPFIESKIPEISTLAAASAYSYLQPILEPKVKAMMAEAIDSALTQARVDADSARKQAVFGSLVLIASIWGAAWWIKKKT